MQIAEVAQRDPCRVEEEKLMLLEGKWQRLDDQKRAEQAKRRMEQAATTLMEMTTAMKAMKAMKPTKAVKAMKA